MKRIFDIIEVVCMAVGILFFLGYLVESLHHNAWLLVLVMGVGLIAMVGAVCQFIRERREK